MLIGHDDKVKLFKKLVADDKLSHGYLFFGEPNVGKSTFALALANFLERGEFDSPEGTISECLFVEPKPVESKLVDAKEGSIGIDSMREVKHFLSQRPSLSKRRVAIISEANLLTDQAQNAILKIAEEPPASSLIILCVSGIDSIISTLQSRLQKIYFTKSSKKEVVLALKKEGLAEGKIDKIVDVSFGRIGRALRIARGDAIYELAQKYLKSTQTERRTILESVVESNQKTFSFVEDIMAELAQNPSKNLETLKDLSDRLTKMSDFVTNKRLQLESALWNI